MPYSERQDNPFDQSLVNGVQTSNKNAADKITDKVGQFVNIVPSYEPRSESETIFDALRQIERQDIEREINRNLKSKKSLPSQARNYLDRVVSKRKV
jgi:hemerythrin superfamily protein